MILVTFIRVKFTVEWNHKSAEEAKEQDYQAVASVSSIER